MTNLILLANGIENKTLENLIEDLRAALKTLPGLIRQQALTELKEGLAGPSFMMIAGDVFEQEEGARLWYITLADWLENYNLWYSLPKTPARDNK